ncbi:MAG TPA: membrane protein insertase YidC [candidate division WOR-3 bacterium]|uniref:Membrane protein insertase YidC n=1 Tax=candidate division WOR-3 bacterium TaxID=2052148 RepID=A0A7V0T5Q9_UNCW3|nr:membrane protein insertase YidC [candidate division WOR-3 bacterium]
MNKDTLRMAIGFAVIVGILIIWQIAFRPTPPAPAPVAAEATPGEPAAETAPPVLTPTPVEAESPPEPSAPAAFAFEPAPDTTVTLENDVLRLTFSSTGGALRSAWLKEYDAELVPEGALLFSAGLETPDGRVGLAEAPFRVRAERMSVTFSVGDDSFGLERTFTLDTGYTVRLAGVARGATGIALDCPAGIAVTEENVKEDLTHFHFYSRSAGKVRTRTVRNLKEPVADTVPVDWVGFKNKYFFVAAFDTANGFDSMLVSAVGEDRIAVSAVAWAGETEATLYLGPLEYNRLSRFGLGFEGAVSLGFVKPVALAILWLLNFLYRIFGNWGLAIIVFAIIMKALFYPLTRTQTGQMRRMQQLQPKLKELKKKFKDDPQALNQETMQLYKLYKINPLSGCLPMLVQLPVFWALYSVLRNFIELRGAGFVLWLNDLSQPDTLFGHLPFFGNPAIGLLPILMGVSFIAQNMLTSADKKNWAMTIIFPIFITVIFLNFPSGLQLYWFMYNVLSIVESLIGLKGGTPWTKRKGMREAVPAPTGRV